MSGRQPETEAAWAKPSKFVPDPVPIVFVGGTGRSGTHVAARLLSRSRQFALIPVECRFHVDEDGFPGLLSGEVSKARFLRRLRGYWWRGFQTNRMRGLHRFVEEERFERAVAVFVSAFDDDAEGACRALFYDLLWHRTESEDPEPAQGIIEQSCDVITQAPTLLKLFDEARFVHIVRDGRDASASRVAQTRGIVYPRTRRQGIDWWEQRLRRIDEGAKAIPSERFHELELGQLLVRGRRRVLRDYAHFAGVRPAPRLRRFMRQKMDPAAANEERWRRGLSDRQQAAIDSRYRDAIACLEADGVSSAPLLRHAYERARD